MCRKERRNEAVNRNEGRLFSLYNMATNVNVICGCEAKFTAGKSLSLKNTCRNAYCISKFCMMIAPMYS